MVQMTTDGLKGYPFALLSLCKKKLFGKGKKSTLAFLLRKYMLVSAQFWGRESSEILRVFFIQTVLLLRTIVRLNRLLLLFFSSLLFS